MRVHPRKRRPLHPSVQSLEALCVVSNLTPGLAPAVESARMMPVEALQTTVGFASGRNTTESFVAFVTVVQPRISVPSPRLVFGHQIEPTTAIMPPPSSPPAATTYLVTPAPTSVGITPPAPSVAPASGGVTQPTLHGGGGSMPSAQLTGTAPPAAFDADTIRPMSMAASDSGVETNAVASSGGTPSGGTPSGGTSSGGTSSGGTPSGGSGGTAPAPPPTLTFSGGGIYSNGQYYDVVGDEAQLLIRPAQNFMITAASVTVQNAVGDSVQFNTSDGNAPALPPNSPANIDEGGIFALTWNWNGTPGVDQVSVSVTYAGSNNPVSATTNANILAPRIDGNSFQDVQQAFQFGAAAASGAFGFHQDAAPNVQGNVFSATVDLPNQPVIIPGSAGVFAFLQTTTFTISQTSQSGETASFKTSAGADGNSPVPVVDDDPNGNGGVNAIFLSSYVTDPGATAGAQNFPVGANGAAYDSPRLGLPTANFPGANTVVKASYNASFVTYLMYKPTGGVEGIWVAIGKLSWSINGTESYNGPFNANTPADYTNLNNWTTTVALTPAISSTIIGATWNGIPTWTGSAQAILKAPPQ